MIPKSFTLRPFPGTVPRFPLEITGSIARGSHTLNLRYEIRGELAAVALPGPAESPARRQGLWEKPVASFSLLPKILRSIGNLTSHRPGTGMSMPFKGIAGGCERNRPLPPCPLPFKESRPHYFYP